MEMVIRLALIVVGAIIILGVLWDGLRKRKKRLSQCAPPPSETDSQKNYKIFHEDILGLHVKIADETTPNNRLTRPVSAQQKVAPLVEKPTISVSAPELKSKREPLCSCPPEKNPVRQEPLLQPIQAPQKPSVKLASVQTVSPKKNQFIAIRIVANSMDCFKGYDLLETFLAHQLRYGDKKLFHRYATENDSSKKLFSLASLDEPGDFDLSEMGEHESSGLILYMDTNEQDDAIFAFEEMLKTAQQLGAGLKGHLMASAHQPWTAEVTEKIRDELGL